MSAGRPEGGRQLAVERALLAPETALTDAELTFTLAMLGIDPPHPHPRSATEAYQVLHPTAQRKTAYVNGWMYKNRIFKKAGLSLFLELKGMAVERILDVLNEGLRAEKIDRYYHRNGTWDYHATPDHARRIEAAKMALFLHGIDPMNPQLPEGSDSRKSFAEIIAGKSTSEQRRMELPPAPDDAQFRDLNPGDENQQG